MSGYEKERRLDQSVATPEVAKADRTSEREPVQVADSPDLVRRQALLWRKLGASRAPESEEEAAALAIEHKSTGLSVDAALTTAVGAHMGVDVSDARVHRDPLSQHATRALGARAFAYGKDVFLGPGESESDVQLMSHELAHVAQQQGAAPRTQTKVAIGDATSPAERQADEVASQVSSGSPTTQHLIVDGGPLAPGQMLKSEFIARLQPLVIATAQAELGPLGSAVGCPYIADYFARYSAQPASSGEALVRKWIPAAHSARSAEELIPLVLGRVRSGVRIWRETGKPPAELEAAEPALGAQAVQARPVSAQRMTLEGLEDQLGEGQALDSATARRMSGALGADVSNTRIHTGPTAHRLAAEHDATAFAVGRNIVIGAEAPATGTLDYEALLAHELAHTAQQQAAAEGPHARRMPIGGEDDAAELDADDAAERALAVQRLGAFARRIGDVMRSDVRLQRCAKDGPQGIDRRAYYEKYSAEIAAQAGEHVRTLSFGIHDPSVQWTSEGAMAFADRVANAIASPETPETLESIVRPEQIASLIDSSRVLDEDGSAYGPDKYFHAVGITVGNAIARRTSESLMREIPRYAQAKVAAAGSEPSPEQIAVSHPIDPLVVKALTTAPSPVKVEHARFKELHPEMAGPAKVHTRTRNIVWEPVGSSGQWRRVTAPSDPTIEELAIAWLGSATEAFRITNAHPLYGIAADTRGRDFVSEMDANPVATLLFEGGSAADEAALAQSGGGAPSRSRDRILEEMRRNAMLLRTSLREAAQRFGLEGRLASVEQRVADRASRLADTKNDAEVLQWDAQVRLQAEILERAGKGLHADGMRLELYAEQFAIDLDSNPGAHGLPHENRLALRQDAELWCDALAVSDLQTTAHEKLRIAAQHSMALEIKILEHSLNTATQAVHASGESASVQSDFDAATMTPREIDLRKRLGQLRAQLYADPTQVDPKASQDTTEETRDLVFESNVILNAIALDQAWKALDDADGVLSTITFDSDDLQALKREGKGYYASWREVYALIKAGEKKTARQRFEQLCASESFQSYLRRVNELLKRVQKHHMIATIVSMVVITVVSMGAGSVVSGLVGGTATAATGATAGTVISTGLGLGRTAGAIAGVLTEAAVFSTLAHVTFTKDRTVGGFLGEFARTLVLFGALRGIAAGFRAAGLDKVMEAGFKADATFAAKVKAGGTALGELVLNGGAGVLEAVLEAKIREALGGKQLTEAEVEEVVRQTVIQTIVMVLVARVAESPLRSLQIKAAFQGSKWREAVEGARNEARAVDALSGGKVTPEQVVAAAKESQAQIKREIAALEELKSKAQQDPKALEGSGLTIAALEKQIASMQTHQTKAAALELALSVKEIAPDHYTCPRENVAEVIATHSRLSKAPPKVESIDPGTGARTWSIQPGKEGGRPFRITEQMPDWAITPSGKRVIEAARRAAFDDAYVFGLSAKQRDALLDADNALAHNDVEGANKALEKAELDPTTKTRWSSALGANHTIAHGRKPLRNEDGSYYDGPTAKVDELKVTQDWVSPQTSPREGEPGIPIPELANRMEKDGWRGQPLEVVAEPSGDLLSIDNRRIVAARTANAQAQAKGNGTPLPEVPVKIHEWDGPFPPSGEGWSERASHFVLKKSIFRRDDGTMYAGNSGTGGTLIYAKGLVPKTWGEAALFRTANQGKSLDPNRYPDTNGWFPVGGTKNTPMIKDRRPPGAEDKQ